MKLDRRTALSALGASAAATAVPAVARSVARTHPGTPIT